VTILAPSNQETQNERYERSPMLNYHRQQPLHLLRVKERGGAMKCGDLWELAMRRLSAHPRIHDHWLSRPMNGGGSSCVIRVLFPPILSAKGDGKEKIDLRPPPPCLESLASNLIPQCVLHVASHISLVHSLTLFLQGLRKDFAKYYYSFLSFMNVCLSVCLYACMLATALA